MSEQQDIQQLRERIDSIDAKLIELLNERASIVVSVGETKREDGTPYMHHIARDRCSIECWPPTRGH